MPLAARTLRGSKSFSDVNFGSSSKGSVKLWANVFGTGQENTLEAALVKKWGYDGYTGAYSEIPGDFYEVVESALAANKGPSVANGWAYVGFQYADEGAIYYCDNVVEMLKKNGVYDDYLGNGAYSLFLRNKEGQVGIPWGVDTRIFWYNEPLLKKAGAEPPTDWPSYLAACKALKKIGVYGFVTSALATNSAYGAHQLTYWMINNGGGLYNAEGKIDIMDTRATWKPWSSSTSLSLTGTWTPVRSAIPITTSMREMKSGRTAMTLVNASLPLETGTSFSTEQYESDDTTGWSARQQGNSAVPEEHADVQEQPEC